MYNVLEQFEEKQIFSNIVSNNNVTLRQIKTLDFIESISYFHPFFIAIRELFY